MESAAKNVYISKRQMQQYAEQRAQRLEEKKGQQTNQLQKKKFIEDEEQKEEVKQEEVKQEEVKQEEVKQEEVKQEEVKQAQPQQQPKAKPDLADQGA